MKRCIVVGAGPGGIVCTKELIEQGLDEVLCLEQSDSLGGTFSNTYDSLLLTSSAGFSMYSDFPIGEGEQHHFWTKAEALDYWTRYADHFGVTERLRLNTRVTRVADDGAGGWIVETQDGETLRTERLALAVGNNSVMRFPDWQAQLTDVAGSHSREYRNSDRFVGKRVLVVGGGESASDVALEIAQVAEKAWVSLRSSAGWVVGRFGGGFASDASTHRGLWGLPRSYGPELSRRVLEVAGGGDDPVNAAMVRLNQMVVARNGIWGIYGTKTMSLPQAIANHGCEVVGEIVDVQDGGTRLVDSRRQVLEAVDEVVFCTGFTNRVDFMPEALQSCDPRSLFKHIFHPDYGDRLAWVGWARPGFGSQFPIMEMQARYFALVASGRLALPDSRRQSSDTAEDEAAYVEQFEATAEGVRSLVDYHRYMDGMAALIGCKPPLLRYLLTRPRLWIRLVYGPTQATQYRLRGPGRKTALAHSILKQLPVSPRNYLVIEGVLGRMRRLFESPLPKSVRVRIPWWSFRMRMRGLRSQVAPLVRRLHFARRA